MNRREYTLKIVGEGYKKYDEITFLRGFSIVTIVLMHFIQDSHLPKIINTMLSVGGTGVHIFFFCSGFGLYLSYLKNKATYFEFVDKRLLKVYIPYIIVVIFSSMIPYMYNGNRFHALMSHIFLYKMFIPEYEVSFGVQFWYISTLFQFYLIFIPLAKLKDKISEVYFLIGCILLSISWWIFSYKTGISGERIWGSFCLQYLWEFAIGMYIAQLMYFKRVVIEVRKITLLIIGFFCLTGAAILKISGGGLNTFNDFFAAIGYGSLALYLYSLKLGKVNIFMSWIASISYELYLLHILVFVSFKQVIDNKVFLIFVSIVVSIYGAKLYRYLLNKKIYRIFSKKYI